MNRKNIFLFLILLGIWVIEGCQAQNTIDVYSTEIPWSGANIEVVNGKIYSINEAINQAKPGDEIIIHEGIYREKVTISKSNLFIHNYQNDYVLVSGCEVVENWQPTSGMHPGVKVSNVSNLNIEAGYSQLFANGDAQIMARHPNNTTGKMMEPLDPNSGYALISEISKDAGEYANAYATLAGTSLPNVDLTGGIFRGLTGKNRMYVFGEVKAVSGKQITFKGKNKGQWINQAAIDKTYHKAGWGFVTHKNLIDVPGEWFLDGDNLYYLPESDSSLQNKRIEIQVRKRVLEINNASGVSFSGINFIAGNALISNVANTAFENCSWRYLQPFWTPNNYGDGESDDTGIYMTGANNTTFTNCYLGHTWGQGFYMASGDNTVYNNCKIEDLGWIGIFASSIYPNGSTTINHCTFGDAGRFHLRIRKNIRIDITDCDFYGAMKMGEDAGPIEATSTGSLLPLDLQGSTFAYNKIHDCKGIPVFGGAYAKQFVVAFYMEDTENYTAHHNLVYHMNADNYKGSFEAEQAGAFLYLGPRYNYMDKPVNYYNNTIWDVDKNINIWHIEADNWQELGMQHSGGGMPDGHFANNIFMNGAGYKLNYSTQEITSTGGTVAWVSSPVGSSIETDDFDEYTTHCAEWGYQFNPENNQHFNFEDAANNFADAANGDFSLVNGSAAIGAGTVLDGYTSSATPDCGALEGGNRVLHAGATITIPEFKEEGTNFIYETEWIKYLDFPEEFIDTTTVFNFTVAYNVFAERDIVISFRSPNDTYLFQGRKTVQAGNDTITIAVTAEQPQPVANDYIFMAALRPKGGAWNENIFTQTLTADIVSTLTSVNKISNKVQLLVYPNPASHSLTVKGLNSNTEEIYLTIYSLSGNTVYQEFCNSMGGELKVDISELSNGMYFLTLDKYPNQKLKFIKK